MNKTEIALAASAVTIVFLGAKLATRTRQVNLLSSQYMKLRSWSKISQRLLAEVVENNPGINLDVTDELETDIDFYNIMTKENLT